MTIHELLQAAGLTANDEIPIWDADGTGEPTKKITAQQLAAAVVTLANLVTSVNNQTGAVSITPANIGAPSTTGSGASGIWNINIPFDSSGATGFKNFSLNAIDIDNTRGNWEAGFSERTNYGTFPAWGGWCHVAQYDCDHLLYQVANFVDSIGGKVYGLSVRSRWESGLWGPWTDIFSTNGAVPVASGGTGATDAFNALKNLFDVGYSVATNYPDKPGIYQVHSSYPIFSNMTPVNPYGILVIFKATYAMHIYLDGSSYLYYGVSTDTFGEPATWYQANATAMPRPY